MKVTEDLQCNGLSIVVDKAGFTYGSDAVLLANFANPRRGDSCLDLGAGTGILAILVNGKTGARFTAVEIQQAACQLMEESIALNGQGGSITVLHTDIRKLVSFCRPAASTGRLHPGPHFPAARERKPRRGSLDTSGRVRHLRRGPVRRAAAEKRRQAMAVLSRLPPCGVLHAMVESRLQPKRLRLIDGKNGPYLALMECVKGGQDRPLL